MCCYCFITDSSNYTYIQYLKKWSVSLYGDKKKSYYPHYILETFIYMSSGDFLNPWFICPVNIFKENPHEVRREYKRVKKNSQFLNFSFLSLFKSESELKRKAESWAGGHVGRAEKGEADGGQGALDRRNVHSPFLMGVGLGFLVTADCSNSDLH